MHHVFKARFVMTQEWFSAKELQGVAGLPSSASSISRKATNEGWKKRQI
ncbi:DNA-binding protein, partial [Cronobacter sakazakii]